MKCDNCDTRINVDDEFRYRGHTLCINCTASLVSWFLDGGMADSPDLFAWVLGVEALPDHSGAFHWRNGAELVWECDDDCPHPGHEEP